MNRTLLRISLPAALLLGLSAPVSAKDRPSDLLGLRPGMSDRDVQHRLEKIGEVVRGEGGAKQTWKLRDPRYGFLILRFDEQWTLHWATAFAREGGRRVRYRDLGDLSQATHTGQHFYTWSIPGSAGAWALVARGGDPRFLDSVSIEAGPRRQALIVPHEPGETGKDED